MLFLNELLFDTVYTTAWLIHGCSIRKNVKSGYDDSLWFHSSYSLARTVRLTVAFHSPLLHSRCDGSNILLIISCKRYLDKSWQISGINPKVKRLLLFRNIISFRVNISPVTDPDGKANILWRNINLRDSIWDCSRFNPTIDSAMLERAHIGKHWMRFVA